MDPEIVKLTEQLSDLLSDRPSQPQPPIRPSPIALAADILNKHRPDLLESAYYRMEGVKKIAADMTKNAEIAYNRYIIPGYSNDHSLPLIMATAVLSPWIDGVDVVYQQLIDSLNYMDADTIIYLWSSVVNPKITHADMGVFENPYTALMGCIHVDNIRSALNQNNVPLIAKIIDGGHISGSAYKYAIEEYGQRVADIAKGTDFEHILHPWTDPWDEDPKSPRISTDQYHSSEEEDDNDYNIYDGPDPVSS